MDESRFINVLVCNHIGQEYLENYYEKLGFTIREANGSHEFVILYKNVRLFVCVEYFIKCTYSIWFRYKIFMSGGGIL